MKQKRVALIVGNSTYLEASSLRNPVSDAARLQVALHRIGFELIVGHDLTFRLFDDKVREFERAIKGADIALFFYAGHGVQYGDRNYLLPTDIQLTSQKDVVAKSVPLDEVLAKMTRLAKASVIFLDACRDSPEFRSVTRGPSTASIVLKFQAGLAAIRPPTGDHFIGFAASPGAAALDGKGRHNSPFTEALLRHVGKPEEIGPMFSAVRKDVMKATANRQVPLAQAGLSRHVYLGSTEGATQTVDPPEDGSPVVSLSEDTEFWVAIRDSIDSRNFDLYLERFPKGRYVVLARRKLDDLKLLRARPPVLHPEVAPQVDEVASASAVALVSKDHPRAEALRSARTLARARLIASKLSPEGSGLPTVVSSSAEAAELLRHLSRGLSLEESWTEHPIISTEVRVELRARVHALPQGRVRAVSGRLAPAAVAAEQPIRLELSARKDARIGVFAWQADGTVLRLYPAMSQTAVVIRGGETVSLPRANDPYPAISSANMPGERSNHEAFIVVAGGPATTAQLENLVPTTIATSVQQGVQSQLDVSEFQRRLAAISDPELEVVVMPYVVRAAR